MFQHFQGCLVRQVDDAQISHSSSCCVEWKENWPETPRETKKKREAQNQQFVSNRQSRVKTGAIKRVGWQKYSR